MSDSSDGQMSLQEARNRAIQILQQAEEARKPLLTCGAGTGGDEVNDIIDALKDLSCSVDGLAQRLQDIRDDLDAVIKDCDELAKTIDDLQEASGK